MAKINNRQEEVRYWSGKKAEYVKKAIEKKKLKPVVYKPRKKQAPINKVSKKQAGRNRQYLNLIKKLKKQPENEICQWPGCLAEAEDCHHGAGRVGDNLLNKEKLKFLCREHHIYAELHPEEAKEVGVSFSRLAIN